MINSTPSEAVPETFSTELPAGFEVRVRDDVAWRALSEPGERLLLGGSPTRALRLKRRALELFDGHSLRVRDASSAQLARQLLDANIADPEPGPAVDAVSLTVVIPVRDRPEQLDRCLSRLGAEVAVIVVDDASLDRSSLHAVIRRYGARLVELPDNLGPAGARNAGLMQVSTPYVAFVDSDVVVDASTLLRLGGYFTDPRLALVGPLVRGVARSARPRWFERYDAIASSLALGRRACSVRAGAAVGWLPGACLVARTAAVRGMDTDGAIRGFAVDMRVGEDVDLVLRLVEEGWRVRYEPAHTADHDARPTITGWLGRKLAYGSGGAPLADRHGDAVAVARLSPLMAAAGAGVLIRRPWSLAVTVATTGWATHVVRRSLPEMPGRGLAAAHLATKGLGWSIRQESALVLRHWWPVAAVACLFSSTLRRTLLSALVADVIVAATVDRPLRTAEDHGPGPLITWVCRRLDDLAYGAGLWLGAGRGRSWGALAIKVVRSPGAGRGATPPGGPYPRGVKPFT